MRAVFLDRLSMEDLDLSSIEAELDSLVCHDVTSPGQVLDRIGDAEVVIANKTLLPAEVLQSAPALRLVTLVATGTNNVDLQAAREAGITVCNCQGYGTQSVVQHVLGLMLALHTNLCAYDRAVRDGRWAASPQFCFLDFPIRELAGRRLGIVGHGTLGQAVGRAAAALGMEVLVAARPGSATAPEGRLLLPKLLSQSDVLSLHCPLTPETTNLIGPREIASMKPGAMIINCARGGIVDESALAQVLKSRTPRRSWCGCTHHRAARRQQPTPRSHPFPISSSPRTVPGAAWKLAPGSSRKPRKTSARFRPVTPSGW